MLFELNCVLFSFCKTTQFWGMHPPTAHCEAEHIHALACSVNRTPGWDFLYFLTFLFHFIFLVNSVHCVLLLPDLFFLYCMFTSEWSLSKAEYSLLAFSACLFLISPQPMMCYVSITLVVIFFFFYQATASMQSLAISALHLSLWHTFTPSHTVFHKDISQKLSKSYTVEGIFGVYLFKSCPLWQLMNVYVGVYNSLFHDAF